MLYPQKTFMSIRFPEISFYIEGCNPPPSGTAIRLSTVSGSPFIKFGCEPPLRHKVRLAALEVSQACWRASSFLRVRVLETRVRSVKQGGPQILCSVNEGANQDVVAILSIENDVRLEPKPARPNQQLVGCDTHFGEVCKKSKCAFEASVVGFRLIGAETTLCKSADVADLVARL